MSNAATLDIPETALSDVADALSAASERGDVAQILDLASRTGSTLTPREINEQLTRVLHNYDELTTAFAANGERLEAEFARLQGERQQVMAQLQALQNETQRQAGALGVLASSTSADIERVQSELQQGLTDAEERNSVQLAAERERLEQEVRRLDVGIEALGKLFEEQQRNLEQQHARMEQFAVMHELLDTATRGNRKRIEAVREDLQTQQTVVSAQVKGLAALARERYAEFVELRTAVNEMGGEVRRLDWSLTALREEVGTHVRHTRTGLRRAYLGVGVSVLLVLAAVAAIKWLPAFAPASSEQALAATRQDLAGVASELERLPALEYRTTAQDARVEQLARSVAGLKQGLGEMSQQIRRLGSAAGIAPALDALTVAGREIRGPQWVAEQSDTEFTLQLAGVGSLGELSAWLRAHEAELPELPLAYTVTQPQGPAGEPLRYNLFAGSYADAEQARAALATLPAPLRANRPWARPWAAVQAAAR